MNAIEGDNPIIFHPPPAAPNWIQKWKLPEREVTLFERGDQLIYSVFQRNTEERTEGTIPDNAREWLLSRIKRCDVEFDGDDIPHFRMIRTQIRGVRLEWEKPKGTLYMQIKEEGMSWRWYAKRSKTVTFLGIAQPSKYDFFIDHLRQYSPCLSLDENVLSNVKVKPVMMRSRIDQRTLFHPREWAITMICAFQSGSNTSNWGGHAMIAVEGWQGDDVFLKYVHLISGGRVHIMENREVRFRKKTETWKVPVHLGEQMMRKVRQDQRRNNTDFYFFGNPKIVNLIPFASYLFGDNRHNCYSYSREVLLEIGVRMPLNRNSLAIPLMHIREGVARREI